MHRALVVLSLAIGLAGATLASPQPPLLAPVADVPLQGSATRFDYQSLDTTSDRLYLAHMGAGELEVVDLGSRRVLATIGGLPRVTGVCSVPSLGKVYASVPGGHQVAILDAGRLAVSARIGDIGFADGIAFAPETRRVFISDESGGGERVIDGVTDRVVATIPLGGEAGNTVYDPGSGHILVAVQTRDEWVEIDPATDRIVARHALPRGSHPHGMAVDPARRRLFVAGQDDARLQVVDLRTLRVIEQHPLGRDPDVLAFDPAWRRLYVASESGTVSVFTERGDGLSEDGAVTIPHAHTVAVDPRTHLVYLPLPDVAGRPQLRILRPAAPAGSR